MLKLQLGCYALCRHSSARDGAVTSGNMAPILTTQDD